MAAARLTDAVHVLIVDDEAPFVEAVEAMLGEDRRIHIVGSAENGRQAVELALARAPDVVLMDISMPVMDGFEATRRILQQRPSPSVLMLTGSDAPEDVDRARRAGAAGYVTKDRIEPELAGAIVALAAR
jgi:DNA-binding NarL/FixJ family response regulator